MLRIIKLTKYLAVSSIIFLISLALGQKNTDDYSFISLVHADVPGSGGSGWGGDGCSSDSDGGVDGGDGVDGTSSDGGASGSDASAFYDESGSIIV